MKQHKICFITLCLAAVAFFTALSACNGNTDDNNFILVGKNIITDGDYTYCLAPAGGDESDSLECIIKCNAKTHAIDTVFNYNSKIENVTVISEGIIIQSYDRYANYIAPRDLFLLRIPSDSLLHITGDCGHVSYDNEGITTFLYYACNIKEAKAAYEYKYDSMSFRIGYDELNESVIASKKKEFENYKYENPCGTPTWLNGAWTNGTALLRVNMAKKTVQEYYKQDDGLYHPGRSSSFTIEDNYLTFNDGHDYVGIDYKNRCIKGLKKCNDSQVKYAND